MTLADMSKNDFDSRKGGYAYRIHLDTQIIHMHKQLALVHEIKCICMQTGSGFVTDVMVEMLHHSNKPRGPPVQSIPLKSNDRNI